MNDMAAAIVPKSDQINADDLLAAPLTIHITGVNIKPGTEQPVAISFSGDNGKPWKPCKSMSRVLVAAWGADAKKYVGRSVTLYRDPAVKWAGMEVGGIRISHMSDIENPITMALTATKGSRKPYTVKPLVSSVAVSKLPQSYVDECIKAYDECVDKTAYEALEKARSGYWSSLSAADKKRLKDASEAADKHLANTVKPTI